MTEFLESAYSISHHDSSKSLKPFISENLNDSIVLSSNPSGNANCFTLMDILTMNKPSPLTLREIQETGAVLQSKFGLVLLVANPWAFS